MFIHTTLPVLFGYKDEEGPVKMGRVWGKGVCVYIKDWFKPVFPLFLNLLLNFLNARARFFPKPPPSVIGRVTTVVTATNGSGRKKQEDVN
jgi:hypothetical protein